MKAPVHINKFNRLIHFASSLVGDQSCHLHNAHEGLLLDGSVLVSLGPSANFAKYTTSAYLPFIGREGADHIGLT